MNASARTAAIAIVAQDGGVVCHSAEGARSIEDLVPRPLALRGRPSDRVALSREDVTAILKRVALPEDTDQTTDGIHQALAAAGVRAVKYSTWDAFASDVFPEGDAPERPACLQEAAPSGEASCLVLIGQGAFLWKS